jgi:hypothetical protein
MPLSYIVAGYDRLGGLCPGEFIQKWWNASNEKWIYPFHNGSQLDINGKPIGMWHFYRPWRMFSLSVALNTIRYVTEGEQELTVGLLIDRFGGKTGKFFAPANSPYSQRSLPPQNLNTPETSPTYPYDYHVYKVKDFSEPSQ